MNIDQWVRITDCRQIWCDKAGTRLTPPEDLRYQEWFIVARMGSHDLEICPQFPPGVYPSGALDGIYQRCALDFTIWR